MLVLQPFLFSCKQRCDCLSGHQKPAPLTALHVTHAVCFPVAHRQVPSAPAPP